MLVESVPNVSEGRRLEVVDRLAERHRIRARGRAPRPHERRQPQPLGVHAGRRARRRRRRARAPRRRGHPRDRHGRPRGRAPADRGGRRHPVRPARHDDDGRRASSSRAGSASGSPAGSTCPVYLYARAARRPDREKLADVRRGQYEGLKTEIGQHGRQPDFGPARMHPSAGAVAVGARPFLIAWNINLDIGRRRARQADRAPRPRVGRRPAAAPGQRVRGPRAGARPPAPRPGVDEPARLRA